MYVYIYVYYYTYIHTRDLSVFTYSVTLGNLTSETLVYVACWIPDAWQRCWGLGSALAAIFGQRGLQLAPAPAILTHS